MNKLRLLLITLLGGLLLSGCLKKTYDPPPDTSGFDPMLPVTHTVAELKNLNGPYAFLTGGDTTIITQDVTIAAIVTADDRSGNFYKAINIEDSTGGIQLLVDAFSLYLTYPVGRKIYIRCKGLTLGYNGGTPVLGYGVSEQMEVNPIPASRVADHIVKASTGHAVVPDTVTMSQITGTTLDRNLVNKLITVTGVEFLDSMGDKSYTQPNNTTNRDFRDCAGKLATVRTSNYADFARMMLPTGRGSITGVFSIFTSATSGRVSPQLTIRDTTDIKMYEKRCSGGTGGPGPELPFISIDSLRRIWGTKDTSKLPAVRITGVVITDASNKNVATGNFTVQSGNRGINIYLGSSGTVPALGDSVTVTISNGRLSKYQGMMEIEGINSSAVKVVASGKTVTPRVVTLKQLSDNFTDYEATLVRVFNVSVQGAPTTYSGNKTIDDGSGATLVLRTSPSATFAGQSVPTTSKSFTGLAGWFGSTKQLLIRNLTDVQ